MQASWTHSSNGSRRFYITLSVVFTLLAGSFLLTALCPGCGPGSGVLAVSVKILGGGNPLKRYSPKPSREPGSICILPLGDSITLGFWTSGPFNAYRLVLLNLLTGTQPLWNVEQAIDPKADFQSVTMLGGNRDGNFTENRHQGHGGAFIYEIRDFFNDAVQNYGTAPDVVLLMAGANDMLQDIDVAHAPGRLGDLIDTVQWRFPGTVMIVAQLTPVRRNETVEERKVVFNRAIPALIEERAKLNWKIIGVDMSAALEITDIADQVHPKDQGQAKMAHVWYNAILDAKGRGWFDRTNDD